MKWRRAEIITSVVDVFAFFVVFFLIVFIVIVIVIVVVVIILILDVFLVVGGEQAMVERRRVVQAN
jgi:hypothetical protein